MNATQTPKPKKQILPIVYCYSGARWDTYPGRQFELMRAMSAHTHVLFLSKPEIKGNLAEFRLPTAESVLPNLTVIHSAFTFKSCRSGKHLGPAAAIPDSIVFHRLLRTLGVKDYIFWLASPRMSLLWGLRTNHLVYDCIDPSPETSGHNILHEKEAALCRRSAAVLCTAESLRSRLAPENPHCYLVSNAARAQDVSATGIRSVPATLQNVKNPIVGFLGTVDFRLDYALLTEAARRLPQITFVIAGHIMEPTRQAIVQLQSLSNVIMTGEVDDELGKDYLAAFSVAIIPFQPGTLGDGINPVKMYMYLAAGKPIVSTWMQECRRHAPLVAATKNADEFVVAVLEEMRTDSPEKAAARLAFARKNTWNDRAAQATEIFSDLGMVS